MKRRLQVRIVVAVLLTAIVVAALFFCYGLSVQAFAYALLAVVLCLATLSDISASVIPNRLVVFGIALWAASVWFVPVSTSGFGIGALTAPFVGNGFAAVALDGILGAVVVAGFVLLVSVVAEQVTGRSMLGGGDVKLLFVAGLYLGLWGSFLSLFLSCVLGLVVALVWRVPKDRTQNQPSPQSDLNAQEKKTEQGELTKQTEQGARNETPSHTFPFGPAIAIATMAILIMNALAAVI